MSRKTFTLSRAITPYEMIFVPTHSIESGVVVQRILEKPAWVLKFTTNDYHATKTSELHFTENKGLTLKLITEVFQSSELVNVGEASIDELIVRLNFGYGSGPYKHIIDVKGKGRHSFVEYKVSPFVMEHYTREVETTIVEDILNLALEDMKK